MSGATSGQFHPNEMHRVSLGSPTTLNPQEVESPLDMRSQRQPPTTNRPLSVRVEEGLAQFVLKVENGLYMNEDGRSRRRSMWDRFRGMGRRKITWKESIRNIVRASSEFLFSRFYIANDYSSKRFPSFHPFRVGLALGQMEYKSHIRSWVCHLLIHVPMLIN